MPDYEITIYREETRSKTITVNAMNENDARHFAREQAGDIDFHECRVVDVDYELSVPRELHEATFVAGELDD